MRSMHYGMLLFANPSFLGGVARTLDIGGTFDSYNDAPSSDEADFDAIASDWYAVGADLLGAMNRYSSRDEYKPLSQPHARSASIQKANNVGPGQ